MQLLGGFLLIIAILAAVVFVAAVAIAMMHRSSAHRSSGSIGNAMQELEGLFFESKRHIIEEQRADKREEKTFSGDEPEKD